MSSHEYGFFSLSSSGGNATEWLEKTLTGRYSNIEFMGRIHGSPETLEAVGGSHASHLAKVAKTKKVFAGYCHVFCANEEKHLFDASGGVFAGLVRHPIKRALSLTRLRAHRFMRDRHALSSESPYTQFKVYDGLELIERIFRVWGPRKNHILAKIRDTKDNKKAAWLKVRGIFAHELMFEIIRYDVTIHNTLNRENIFRFEDFTKDIRVVDQVADRITKGNAIRATGVPSAHGITSNSHRNDDHLKPLLAHITVDDHDFVAAILIYARIFLKNLFGIDPIEAYRELGYELEVSATDFDPRRVVIDDWMIKTWLSQPRRARRVMAHPIVYPSIRRKYRHLAAPS